MLKLGEMQLAWHTLMNITKFRIRRHLTMPAIRRGTVIVGIGERLNHLRKDALVNIAGWEVGITEITGLISIIEFKVQ